jgi:hypothetical protein
MERKTFAILASLSVVAALLVWWIGGKNATTDNSTAAVPLVFPQLAGQLSDVRKIVVTDATTTTTLARQGDGWVSETFGGYPADAAVVRQFLYSITRLQRLEAKTGNAKLFDRLGLTPPDVKGSRAVHVQLLDAQGKALVDYLQGDVPAAATGETTEPRFYLLETGKQQAWLAGGGKRAEAMPAAWIGKDLINIDQERVKELTVMPPSGETLTVYRDTPLETAFKIKGIKGADADKDKAAQPVADALGSLFAFVRFEAVQPRARVQLRGKPYRVQLVTFDGLSVSLAQYDTEEGATAGAPKPKAWAVFSAEVLNTTDEPADWQQTLKQGERELPLKTRELVEAEARAIEALGARWVVQLQDFKADRLRNAPQDLGGQAGQRR